MNVLLRTVYDKPEMLYLSIKYEKIARDYFNDDYLTIFAVDYGANPKCLEVIKDYQFDYIIVERPVRHFVCANVLGGLKAGCKRADDYIINMEDDVILHKSYFEFVKKAHDLVKSFGYSAITTWGLSPTGDPSILKESDYFCGPGTVINKQFFEEYIVPYATRDYYRNWVPTIQAINELNRDNTKAKYKVGNLSHLDWDGLANRLVDYASFSKGLHSYSSACFRLLHIGFYGFNRRGGKYPSGIISFDDKVSFLESNIFNPDMLSKLDGVYKDYHIFDTALDAWDGSLRLEV